VGARPGTMPSTLSGPRRTVVPNTCMSNIALPGDPEPPDWTCWATVEAAGDEAHPSVGVRHTLHLGGGGGRRARGLPTAHFGEWEAPRDGSPAGRLRVESEGVPGRERSGSLDAGSVDAQGQENRRARLHLCRALCDRGGLQPHEHQGRAADIRCTHRCGAAVPVAAPRRSRLPQPGREPGPGGERGPAPGLNRRRTEHGGATASTGRPRPCGHVAIVAGSVHAAHRYAEFRHCRSIRAGSLGT
jgi:hypothetical protein